jgi:hypothetical protein
MKYSMYFTSNQSSSEGWLGTNKDVYQMMANWGKRLRKAMGEEEILDRNHRIGGEFRVPTFRQMAESLDRNVWEAYSERGDRLWVVPYNSLYDGWTKSADRHRAGFMCSCFNSYEYAYEFWDKWMETSKYHPHLLDNATFAAWAELLPEPYSLTIENNTAVLSWAKDEPRVHRSEEMGRYQLSKHQRIVEVTECSWRVARAEAYVQAWEKMAANEPADRYKDYMLKEHEELMEKWRR